MSDNENKLISEKTKAILTEAQHLLESSDTDAMRSWVNQAKAYTMCLDAKIDKELGYPSFSEFVRIHFKRDGEYAGKLVKAYTRLGEARALRLTYRHVKALFEAPEEAVNAILKNKKSFHEFAEASSKDSCEITKKVSANLGTQSVPKTKSKPLHSKTHDDIQAKQKHIDRRSSTHAAKKEVEERSDIMTIKAGCTKIKDTLSSVMKAGKKLQAHQFENSLDSDLTSTINDFCITTFSPVQHAQMAASHLTKMIGVIEHQIKHGEGEINITGLLNNYEFDIEKCRAAISKFDNLRLQAKKADSVVFLDSRRRANS